MNEELGSKRLGLFRLRDAGTPARGECLLRSDMRGEAGLTVLGDGFRDVCFDIILCDVGNGVDERVRGSKGSRLMSYYSDIDSRKVLSLAWVFLDGRLNGDQAATESFVHFRSRGAPCVADFITRSEISR